MEIHGHPMSEEETQSDDPEFLMEIMEINENLIEADSLEAVRDIGKQNALVIKELTKQLAAAFKEQNFETARNILKKFRYYTNIDEKVNDFEMNHL